MYARGALLYAQGLQLYDTLTSKPITNGGSDQQGGVSFVPGPSYIFLGPPKSNDMKLSSTYLEKGISIRAKGLLQLEHPAQPPISITPVKSCAREI